MTNWRSLSRMSLSPCNINSCAVCIPIPFCRDRGGVYGALCRWTSSPPLGLPLRLFCSPRETWLSAGLGARLAARMLRSFLQSSPNLAHGQMRFHGSVDNDGIGRFFEIGKLAGKHLCLEKMMLPLQEAGANQFLAAFQIDPGDRDTLGERLPIALLESGTGDHQAPPSLE